MRFRPTWSELLASPCGQEPLRERSRICGVCMAPADNTIIVALQFQFAPLVDRFHHPNAIIVRLQHVYVAPFEYLACGLTQSLDQAGDPSVGFAISRTDSSYALLALIVVTNRNMQRLGFQAVFAHLVHEGAVPFAHPSFCNGGLFAADSVKFLCSFIVRNELAEVCRPRRSRPACRVKTFEIARSHAFQCGRIMNRGSANGTANSGVEAPAISVRSLLADWMRPPAVGQSRLGGRGYLTLAPWRNAATLFKKQDAQAFGRRANAPRWPRRRPCR